MKNNRSVVPTFAAVAILVMAAAISPLISVDPVQAAADPIVVIVNRANPVDNLTMAELRKFFLSDRSHWDTGRAVAPVMLGAGAPERVLFLKVVFGMNDADLERYFLQADFTGKSVTRPKEVGTVRELRRMVGNSPGAIGFVRFSDLQTASDSVIKVVRIDGVAPTDAAYRIHM
jgi:ABC-type phosphate transport system substrate-binding protein